MSRGKSVQAKERRPESRVLIGVPGAQFPLFSKGKASPVLGPKSPVLVGLRSSGRWLRVKAFQVPSARFWRGFARFGNGR